MKSLEEMLARPQMSKKETPITSLRRRRDEFNSNPSYWLYTVESVYDEETQAKVFSYSENKCIESSYPILLPYFTVYIEETGTYEKVYFSCDKHVSVGWIDNKGTLRYTDIHDCYGEVVVVADQFPTFIEMPETNGLTYNANVFKEIKVSDSLHLYPLKSYSTPILYFWDEVKEDLKNLYTGLSSKVDTQIQDYVALPTERWYGIYLIPGETLATMNVCYVVVPLR